ncbi:MAG TPA: 2-phospho-L-lactate guanylyltransferase [Candidatus Dormibacteraeota bacterium]|jgi:2-phospho-L-lactate guanylyltransferase|nr:2-phospho-L-lactate guanylyltransferase [Candidatus Dormibacteraeota bacterium]
MSTWVVVLVKDFDSAKQRMVPALGPAARRALARRNAVRAIRAAAAGDRRLVVAGGEEAAALAESLGVEALLEPRQEGQNVAAQRGIGHAIAGGADAVLLLSSDLPLVTTRSVRELLAAAALLIPPAVMAVPAVGRGGTNALFIKPPRAIGLHFGADSLAAFRREARNQHVHFALHQSPAMALDLDEPADLARLRRAV